MEKINCPSCDGISVKNGKQKGRQRYRCKHCQKSFQSEYEYKAYCQGTNDLIKNLGNYIV